MYDTNKYSFERIKILYGMGTSTYMAHRPVPYQLNSGVEFYSRLPKLCGCSIDGIIINTIFISTMYNVHCNNFITIGTYVYDNRN